MNKPLISVIIPVYKVEEYINQCVDSVLNQTYKNIEVILVDDGSPDNCPKICDEYAKKDNRVKVIHKKNGGLSSARNAGIEYSTGEYLCFIDSDDYWDSKKMINDLILNIDSKDFIYFGYKTIVENKISIVSLNNALIRAYKDGVSFLDNALSINPVYCWYAWQYIFKSSIWKDYNIRFPENTLYEDTATIYKAILVSKGCCAIDINAYCYRNRSNSITQKHNIKSYIDHLEVCNNAINDINSRKEIDLRIKKKINNCFSATYYAVVNELSLLDKKDKDIVLIELINKKNMMNYTNSNKQLFARALIRAFGINISAFLLGFRRKIKYGS